MKIFLAVFAAILCAAAAVIGYLRVEARLSDWQNAKRLAVASVQKQTDSIARLQIFMQQESAEDAKAGQEVMENLVARQTDARSDLLSVLAKKPYFGLNAEETALLSDSKRGIEEYRASHGKSR